MMGEPMNNRDHKAQIKTNRRGALAPPVLVGDCPPTATAAQVDARVREWCPRCQEAGRECEWREHVARGAAEILRRRGDCRCLTCLVLYCDGDNRLAEALVRAVAEVSGERVLLVPHERDKGHWRADGHKFWPGYDR